MNEPNSPRRGQGFFNRAWVQNILPLATALLFHVVIIGIGLVLARTYQRLVNPNQQQVIIPDAKIVDRAKLQFPTRNAAAMVPRIELPPAAPAAGLESSIAPAAPSIDPFGVGPSVHSGHDGFNPIGDGPSQFRVPTGTTGKVEFITGTANANNVVYLIDCSGSMLNVFNFTKMKLKQSINGLRYDPVARQRFNIIFFSDEGPKALFPTKELGPITAENRKKAMDFIDAAYASGGTIPLPAIREAMAQTPRADLIYVMTDGFDNVADFDEVIRAFKPASGVLTKVNTIYIPAAEDPKLREVLKKIAANGGGVYTEISRSEVEN